MMDAQRVDMFLYPNSKYFPPESISQIRDRLLATPEDQFYRAQAIEYKDPTTLLLISVLLGTLGVDRFMLGDIGMGVLKLLTGGVCGILWIIDICTIQKTVRDQNFQAIMTVM